MAFFLSRLEFSDENVLVDLNFLFAFLHGHLKLVLLVFLAVDDVSCGVYGITQGYDFQLHSIVLDEGLLLNKKNLVKVVLGHLVFHLQLLNSDVKNVSLLLLVLDRAPNIAMFVQDLLVLFYDHIQVGLVLAELII
jgi:hypothetical protein